MLVKKFKHISKQIKEHSNTMFHKALNKLCHILGDSGKPLTYTELNKCLGKMQEDVSSSGDPEELHKEEEKAR